MDEKDNGSSVSTKKLEANRRNAKLSTGPKTDQGKANSRRNSLKHGVLASVLLVSKGLGAEDSAEFEALLETLREHCAPVNIFEEMMVEKIAICWWKERRILQCEAGRIERSFVPRKDVCEALKEFSDSYNPEEEKIKDHLRLPLGDGLDQILRYETANQRQFVHALNQLERLQRMRKGESVPVPVNVQVLTHH